jgi:hypothetical protein
MGHAARIGSSANRLLRAKESKQGSAAQLERSLCGLLCFDKEIENPSFTVIGSCPFRTTANPGAWVLAACRCPFLWKQKIMVFGD